MTIDDIDELVNRVKDVAGRATATAFIEPEADERHFIAETILTAAALFLLNKYFSGFFKPVEEMGRRHGMAAARLLEGLSKGVPPDASVEASRDAIRDAVSEAKVLDAPERRAAAEEEVRGILREHGESAAGAARKASEITEAIFGR